MSEYQYYEFRALDRQLTVEEMAELGRFSSRAEITPTGFVNEYSYGSFKGDAEEWMRRYFDAFYYIANWGSQTLALRLSGELLDYEVARVYQHDEGLDVERTGSGEVVVTFEIHKEDGYGWVEGKGRLNGLLGVRSELARGDLRALYLGWLLYAQRCSGDDGGYGDEDDGDDEDSPLDVHEPPVPAGLGKLSPALQRLVELLGIDVDLLHVAAERSAPLEVAVPEREAIGAWIEGLPAEEKDALLTRLVAEVSLAPILGLRRRFLDQRAAGAGEGAEAPRTIRQLLAAADARFDARQREEAERRAAAEAARLRAEAAAKEQRLDRLAGRVEAVWGDVATLVATKQAKHYDEAVALLLDLRELEARDGGADFLARLVSLRQRHATKRSFIERLDRAGLVGVQVV